LIYSYAFILDPRGKWKGFVNVLGLLAESTGVSYTLYMLKMRCPGCLASMRRNLVVQVSLKGLQCPQPVLVRISRCGEGSMEVLVHLLVFPPHVHLVHLLLVSFKLTWIVT